MASEDYRDSKCNLELLLSRAVKRKDDLKHNQSFEAANELVEISKKALNAAHNIKHEHGKGVALEMLAFGMFFQLKLDNNSSKINKETFDIMIKMINESKTIARQFGDVPLALRILELLANVYRFASMYESEVKTIEAAVLIERTIPKVLALLKAYDRFLYNINKLDREKEVAQKVMETNFKYWAEYKELRLFPGITLKSLWKYIGRSLYHVSVYVGTILSSPVNETPNFPEAKDAFNTAVHMSKEFEEHENFCAAFALKTRSLYGQYKNDKRDSVIKKLEFYEEKYRPKDSEIRDLLSDLQQANMQKEDLQNDIQRLLARRQSELEENSSESNSTEYTSISEQPQNIDVNVPPKSSQSPGLR